ncbi:uncharacterized protein MELLADRAFT_93075 [Melampsora larici-populina 98AG31]|uniref:Uncharacterized protein n=1 Tax=Melampsora larici-populina (strain 98AG31 / pathotype 3-4-7) TaxID=747676 RepID=F4S3V0_MELLP|nr:uncharacterized protein MELLADRAFT_93075 [Melampsora larici-populina 98AG31]EGG00680.1 hypothetical protein MELLADRAFT_93075 [Melampsora larici-populina 98AG31]
MPRSKIKPATTRPILRSQTVAKINKNISRTKKPVKRKKDLDLDSDSDSEPSPQQDFVEKAGLSIGRKTTREKLLELLGTRAKPKKPRISSQLVSSRRNSKAQNQDDQLAIFNQPSDKKTDYSNFDDDQLFEMLKTVGLDTTGFDRIELLKNCNAYTELTNEMFNPVIIPSSSQKQAGPDPIHPKRRSSSSTLVKTQASTSNPGGSIHEMVPNKSLLGEMSTSLPKARKSVTFLATPELPQPLSRQSDRSRQQHSETQLLIEDDQVATDDQASDEKTDYSHFDDGQLFEMLKTVGLDTTGFERIDLLKNCKAYTDLTNEMLDTVILPSPSQQQVDPDPKHPKLSSSSSSLVNTQAGSKNPGSSINEMIPNQRLLDKMGMSTPESHQSGSLLPSLEHKRFLYPRPRPTILSSATSTRKKTDTKGKAKAVSPNLSDSDWNPEDQHRDGSDTENDTMIPEEDSDLPSPLINESQSPLRAHSPKDYARHESSTGFNSKTLDIETLHILLIQTNRKVESLENDVKTLTNFVHKLAGTCGDHDTPRSKGRGGRTSDFRKDHNFNLHQVQHPKIHRAQ